MPLRLNNLLFACFVLSGMVLKQYIRLKASVSKVESNYFNKTNFVVRQRNHLNMFHIAKMA